MKEIIIASLISSLIGGGAATGLKFYADHTYVAMTAYERSNNNNRIWQLQDRVNDIKDRAVYEKRNLTPYEQIQIRRDEAEIKRLGGIPQ